MNISTASIELNNTVNSVIAKIPTGVAVQSWQAQQANYRRWWNWYTGDALLKIDENAKTDDGSPAYYYPLRINPIAWVVNRHVSALFGEVSDEAESMFSVSYTNPEGKKDDTCTRIEDVFAEIWYQSGGREAQIECATYGQFLGGAFIAPRWDPDVEYGIRFQAYKPDFVLPIYSPVTYEIYEAYIMYYISGDEAREVFGVNTDSPRCLYVEKWTKNSYEVTIDGSPASIFKKGLKMSLKGLHDFGEVPLVYIPHPPRVGSFYGVGHVDDLSGLSEELNRRMADVGDNVKNASYPLLVMRDVTGKLDTRQVLPGINALNMGTSGMTGKSPEIQDIRLDTAASIREGLNFSAELLQLIDRASFLTGVAYGEDEGSQRSGVTLATRMWPLAAHIRTERNFWREGIRRLHRISLKMMLSKGVPGITQEMLRYRASIRWATMLPLDRAALVKEMVDRKQVGLVSVNGAVEQLNDGSDVAEEISLIEADADAQANRDAKVAQAGQPIPVEA
jgi:Phage portal protein, SPP1 Gp6-like